MTAHYSDLQRETWGTTSVGEVALAHPPSVVPLPPRGELYRRGVKRALDLIAVTLTAPAVLLVILVLAFTIALDGGRPFYTQSRVGQGARHFRIWKLRSMVVDADARLQIHLERDPAARAEWDETQKLKNDPRVTRLGRLLRRSSLDELPQLWNVLKGDMSLVGPRPMMPSQQVLYPGTAYFALRPGITGLWQVSQRNETSFAERAFFDNDYHRRLSFALDTTVLLATIRVVLRGTGY